MPRSQPALLRITRAGGIVVGVVLAGIGIRFIVDPDVAATFFGIGQGTYRTSFHHVIAVRDIWLGVLAIALAALKEWRALALWLGLGTLVCFADAGIAAAGSGRFLSLAFHLGSGVLLAVLTGAAWRLSKSPPTR
jgi:hypothetical protein